MSWDLEKLRESVRATERRYVHELSEEHVQGWVDVHTHVLPGVDDGASSFEDALEMLHQAWESGTRELIATPHMFRAPFDNFDIGEMKERFSRFAERLREVALGNADEYGYLRDLKISLGSENYVSPEFLQAMDRGHVLPLGNTSCLLIEFPSTLPAAAAESAVQRVIDRGFQPVLAHVERVAAFSTNPEALENLVSLGAVAQVNLGSLLDANTATVAAGHLQGGRARVVASDGHDVRSRSIRLDGLGNLMGPRRLRTLVEEGMSLNPRRLLGLANGQKGSQALEAAESASHATS